jgi:hypothetical protein
LYLWNSKFPVGGDHGGLLWDKIVGRAPADGEGFWRFDRSSASFVKTTSIAGTWDNGNPTLNVGEAGFFDVGGTGLVPAVIPEPTTTGLLGLGTLFCWLGRQKRQ